MGKNIKFFLAAVFLVFVLSSVSAVTYVRAGAIGANNGSDWTNAYTNLSSINWSKITPGSTICLSGGTYSGTLAVSSGGNSSSPVIIKRAIYSDPQCGSGTSGWNNIYDSQVIINANPYYGISFGKTGISYITIDGLVDKGIKINVPNIGGNTDSTGIKFINGADHIIINHLDIAGPDSPLNVTSIGDNRCIATNAWNGNSYELVSNFTISNNYLHGCVDLIYLGKVDNVIIERNKFYDAIAPSPLHTNVVISFSSSNVIFRYNDVYNWNTEGILLDPTSPLITSIGRWDIYGNIFHDGVSGGIISSGDRVLESQSTGSGPIYFYNNVVANVWSAISGLGGTSFSSDSKFMNNIFWNIYALHANYNPDRPFVLTGNYNLYDLPVANEINGVITSSNPFVNSAGRDYHLSSSSLAINRGINLSESQYNLDLDGNIRGADGVWDIGAYEYTNITITNYHIADTNTDNNISSLELNNYISGYLSGSYNLKNALYLITLKQKGGKYNYNSSSSCDITPWNCYVNI